MLMPGHAYPLPSPMVPLCVNCDGDVEGQEQLQIHGDGTTGTPVSKDLGLDMSIGYAYVCICKYLAVHRYLPKSTYVLSTLAMGVNPTKISDVHRGGAIYNAYAMHVRADYRPWFP